ncbi:MAG: helix-turn-helix transcriptional regulator [Planctomycetota bacterium]
MTDACVPKFGRFASNPPGASYGPRRMRDFEFVWMAEGDAHYRWGDAEAAVPEGSVVLCRPGATDAFDWDPRRRSVHGYVHFDLPRPPKHWPAVEAWPLVRTPPDGDVFRPMLRHLLARIGRAEPRHVALTLEHLVSCFLFEEWVTQPTPTTALPEPIPQVLAFIHARLGEDPTLPISLDELADAAHLHPASLCRRVKQATGHTPMRLVRYARLDLALQQLIRSASPVQAVAAATGFESPYHFSRRFREAFGTPPSELQAAVRRGQTPPLPLLHRYV